MAIVAVEGDWDHVRWTIDGRRTQHATSIQAVVGRLTEPTVVLCEPAFYDGLRDVRDVLREVLSDQGHGFASVSRGARAVLEAASGNHSAGTGVKDLYAIVVAGVDGIDWQVGRRFDRWDVRDALDVVHAIDIGNGSSSVAAQAVNVIGPYAGLDAQSQSALGDGSRYRLDVLLAAHRAASVATNRGDFERFLGLTEGASGSGMVHTIRSWYAACNTTTEFDRESNLTWSEYRRALRICYHRVTSARRLPGSAAA